MSKNEVHSERGAFPHYPPGDMRLSAVLKQCWGRLPQHAVVVVLWSSCGGRYAFFAGEDC